MPKSIPYSDEAAQEIADRWGIAPATINVWKHRGKIPSKYLVQKEARKRLPDSLQNAQNDLIVIAKHPWIVQRGLENLAGVRGVLIKDVGDRKHDMSSQELSALAKALEDLTQDIRRTCKEKAQRDSNFQRLAISLVCRRVFSTYEVVERDKRFYDRIMKSVRGGTANFSDQELKMLRNNLLDLADAIDPKKVIEALGK